MVFLFETPPFVHASYAVEVSFRAALLVAWSSWRPWRPATEKCWSMMQVLPAQLNYIQSMMKDAALKHVSVYQIDDMVSPADTCTKIEHIGSTRCTWIARLFASLINETDVPAALPPVATWTCLITLLCILWMHTIPYFLMPLVNFLILSPGGPGKGMTKLRQLYSHVGSFMSRIPSGVVRYTHYQ